MASSTTSVQPLDIAIARADTPAVERVMHLNNAGAALMPNVVFDVVVEHLTLERDRGGYEAAKLVADRLDGTYESLAQLVNCQADEIALLENATRAWGMVFYAMDFKPGDRILTARHEYVSNYLAYLQIAERTGAIIETVPDDELGQLSLDALWEMVDEHVKLISVTHVPTSSGVVNPAAGIGKIAKKVGAFYLLDACQSVGQIDLDVEHIGCDFLSGTSRKYLRGPRGAGFLYVRRELIEKLHPPFIDVRSASWSSLDGYDLRADAKRFESFEGDTAVRLGLGTAVTYALQWGMAAIEGRVASLAAGLRDRLSRLDGIEVLDRGEQLCGIVSFCSDVAAPSVLVDEMRSIGVNLQAVPVTHSRIDMEDRGLDELIRASVHYYNTEQELDRFAELLSEQTVVHRGRARS